MKKAGLFLVSLIMFMGCSDDSQIMDFPDSNQTEVLSNNKSVTSTSASYGDMHNELLALMEQAEANGEIIVDVDNKRLSEDMINIIDNYFLNKGFEVQFSTMLSETPSLPTDLNSFFDADHGSAEQLRNIIINTDDPSNIKDYALLIFDTTINEEGTNELSGSLNNIRATITSDQTLSELQKDQLSYIISIAESSNTYWYPANNSNSYTTFGWGDRFVYLAGSDTAAAILMIQSGAVATGAALTATVGGWGGLAVLVGGAAAGSFMASRR